MVKGLFVNKTQERDRKEVAQLTITFTCDGDSFCVQRVTTLIIPPLAKSVSAFCNDHAKEY
jgi:hypothetical protein